MILSLLHFEDKLKPPRISWKEKGRGLAVVKITPPEQYNGRRIDYAIKYKCGRSTTFTNQEVQYVRADQKIEFTPNERCKVYAVAITADGNYKSNYISVNGEYGEKKFN